MTTEELIVERFKPDLTCLPFRATTGTREELAALFGELGFRAGAEIGVYRGWYSTRLCRNIPGLEITCVDWWKKSWRTSQFQMNENMRYAQQMLAPYGAKFIRKRSVEAADDVPDGSLDFVYVDANHKYKSVKEDIVAWYGKVREGGIMAGHDYSHPHWPGQVEQAVREFTGTRGVKRWYITAERLGSQINPPSWFFVKPATKELIVEKFGINGVSSAPLVANRGDREELAALFGELGFKTGAEIGVRKGWYSWRLCRNIPNLKLKCVDPWLAFRRNSQDKMDYYFEYAKKLLAPYDAEIIKKTSEEAAKDVSDGSLDFVFIDAMHEYDSVLQDITLWTPKVRVGGIVSGHDYSKPNRYNGVVGAVKEYTMSHGIDEWYVTLEDNEHAPSWFWVK